MGRWGVRMVGAWMCRRCFLRCSKLELRWRVCSASLLDHILSNTHVIVFVKPVLSSLEVGASRVLGRLGCRDVGAQLSRGKVILRSRRSPVMFQ